MEKNLQELLSMTNSQNRFPLDDEYLDEDGYIKCNNCHTRRRTDDYLIIDCACDREARERERIAEFKRMTEHQRKVNMLKSLREKSLLGERYRDCTFEDSVIVSEKFQTVLTRCERYCSIADEVLAKGYGLYIYGASCGTGKTHLTACMCNALLDQYQKCMFTNITDISKVIMATFNGRGDTDRVIKQYVDVDFLFLDDIGTEVVKKNEGDNWLQNQIYEIINLRYNNLKPTIFTSNYSLAELTEKRGLWHKTVDRIAEMSSAIINLEGESFRLRKKKNSSVPF